MLHHIEATTKMGKKRLALERRGEIDLELMRKVSEMELEQTRKTSETELERTCEVLEIELELLAIDEEVLEQSQCYERRLLTMPTDNSVVLSTMNEGLGNDTDIVRQYDDMMELVIDRAGDKSVPQTPITQSHSRDVMTLPSLETEGTLCNCAP